MHAVVYIVIIVTQYYNRAIILVPYRQYNMHACHYNYIYKYCNGASYMQSII